MPDILNTSLTGLRAFQSALATTSHNIANVNTEGYSRQRVNFGTMPAQNVGVGYIGSGVQPQSVVRILDQYRVDSLRANVSEEVADNPSSVSARQVALSQANVLSDRFSTLNTRLEDQNNQVNARLSQAVTQVNALAESVADLNLAIRDAQAAAGGAPPNRYHRLPTCASC